MRVKMETKMPAPPIPATARPNMRKSTFVEIAQNKDPSSKMKIDIKYTLLHKDKIKQKNEA
jgi:hypothetical protein